MEHSDTLFDGGLEGKGLSVEGVLLAHGAEMVGMVYPVINPLGEVLRVAGLEKALGAEGELRSGRFFTIRNNRYKAGGKGFDTRNGFAFHVAGVDIDIGLG